MPIPVGQLVKHQKELITVSALAPLSEALALMTEHKFSQLPVVDGEGKPTGMVTADSIISALVLFKTGVESLKAKDAAIPPTIFRADGDLILLLDNILSATAAFVTRADGKLLGIITGYDTTQYFRQRAENLVFVEDIEHMLKNLILEVYGATSGENDALRKAIADISNPLDDTRKKGMKAIGSYCSKNKIDIVQADAEMVINSAFPLKPRPFDELTLFDYILLVQKEWDKFNSILNIETKAWSNMMESIRLTRNKLAHFRGEVTISERSKLRHCLQWFEAHQHPQKDTTTISDAAISDSQTPNTAEQSPPEVTVTEDGSIPVSSYKRIGKTINRVVARSDSPKDIYNVYLETIESIIKASLPKSAYEHITWWTEDPVKTKAWEDEGWGVRSLHSTAPKPYVVFQRVETSPDTPKEVNE